MGPSDKELSMIMND